MSLDMLGALNEFAERAAKEDAAQRKAELKSAEDGRQRAVEVQSMTTHPGWKHFEKDMAASIRMAWSRVVSAADQHAQTRAVGELHAMLLWSQWAKALIESASEAPPAPQ